MQRQEIANLLSSCIIRLCDILTRKNKGRIVTLILRANGSLDRDLVREQISINLEANVKRVREEATAKIIEIAMEMLRDPLQKPQDFGKILVHKVGIFAREAFKRDIFYFWLYLPIKFEGQLISGITGLKATRYLDGLETF